MVYHHFFLNIFKQAVEEAQIAQTKWPKLLLAFAEYIEPGNTLLRLKKYSVVVFYYFEKVELRRCLYFFE